jgi:propanol-preferring alcohol dehydrogenase
MRMIRSWSREVARRGRSRNNRNADEAAEPIRKITGIRGAGLVLDCIGVQSTIDLREFLGCNSLWTIVGLGGTSQLSSRQHLLRLFGGMPYRESRVELMEVIAMSRDGASTRDNRVSVGAGSRSL